MKFQKETVVLKGSSHQAIQAAIGEALENGAYKVLYDKSRQYILYQRPLKEDETVATEAAEVYRTARLNQMIDFGEESVQGMGTYNILYHMYSIFSDRQLYPNYVLVRDIESLNRWLVKPAYSKAHSLFGAKILEYEELEDDVFLLCGTESKNPEPFDVVLTVKGYLHA